MKNNAVLKLSVKSAVKMLQKWKSEYVSADIDLQFSDQYKICSGKTEYTDIHNTPTVIVGMYPLPMSFPSTYLPIKDSDFVRIGVTTFHELTHCKRSLSDNTPKEIQISDLSKCYNKEYYYAEHHKLPHEIDAEYSGVMSMWSLLERDWPDAADRLMFDYLDDRTEKSVQRRKLYMIEKPECGFQSKQQVKDLFNEAYEKSLTEKRSLPDRFISYDGDTSRVLATDNGYGVRAEYVSCYSKLYRAETGADTDRMMASLVSYVHPELQDMYPGLDFEELEPGKVFGRSMPETVDEVRIRLGYNDSFAEGVDYVTGLQNKGQEL